VVDNKDIEKEFGAPVPIHWVVTELFRVPYTSELHRCIQAQASDYRPPSNTTGQTGSEGV
jgi:hypothetical protein